METSGRELFIQTQQLLKSWPLKVCTVRHSKSAVPSEMPAIYVFLACGFFTSSHISSNILEVFIIMVIGLFFNAHITPK